MRLALLLAVVSMLFWGLWTTAAKFATESISPALAMALSYGTGALIALGYALTQDGSITLAQRGVAFGVTAGVFAGVAGLAFYTGLNEGRASSVTTISSLYFLVTTLLGVLVLDETLATTDVAGIGFAIVAVTLLAQ